MITRLGELSLSDVVPLLSLMHASLSTAVGIALPELQGKLAGLANVLAAITVAPPALGATITAALKTVASLQLAVSGPTVTLQGAAIVALMAELNVSLGLLTGALGLSIPSAVVSAYVYDGPSGQIGVELQSAINGSLPGAPGHSNALILATTEAAVWGVMGQVFRL